MHYITNSELLTEGGTSNKKSMEFSSSEKIAQWNFCNKMKHWMFPKK